MLVIRDKNLVQCYCIHNVRQNTIYKGFFSEMKCHCAKVCVNCSLILFADGSILSQNILRNNSLNGVRAMFYFHYGGRTHTKQTRVSAILQDRLCYSRFALLFANRRLPGFVVNLMLCVWLGVCFIL